MKLFPLLLTLTLAITAPGAQITFLLAPDGSSVDLVIGDVGASPVGAYDLTVGYDPVFLAVGFDHSLGFLGIPGVDTIEANQNSGAEIRVLEISLLAAPDLQALQPATFGLVRLSLQWHGNGAATLRLSGIVSDAAGNPISTTFTNGAISQVPEPGTFGLFASALFALIRYRSARTPGLQACGARLALARVKRRS